MKKSLLVIALGLINSIYSLSLVINMIVDGVKNRETYGNEVDFYFTTDSVVWLISGIIILIIGIKLYKEGK